MSIERRRWKRVPVNITADISSGSTSYKGLITSASLYGAGYLIASLQITTEDFSPDRIIKLSFRLPSGEYLDLNCEIRWFEWETANGYATVGMKIIDSLSTYEKFIRTLTDGHVEHIA